MIFFHCPAAPLERVPNPDFGEPHEPAMLIRALWPRPELSSTNAAAVLDLLDLPAAPCGDIAHEALPGHIRVLERQLAVALAGGRTRLHRDAREYDGNLAGALGQEQLQDDTCALYTTRVRVIDLGRSTESIVQRLQELLALFRAALEYGHGVQWD